MADASTDDRLSTGVPNIDTILDGGLLPGRSILVRGPPGAGKTLFGLHYLTGGATEDETSLFINFGEPEDYIREDAAEWGFNLEHVHFLDLTPSEDFFVDDEAYDLFSAAEVEGQPLAEDLTETVEEITPNRVFIDPLTQLRYLASDPHQFRKQVLSLLRFLKHRGATTVFTSQDTTATPDDDLQFMSDGILHFGYTADTRTVRVSKFRGSDFQKGSHSLRITDEGMTVAPELVPEAYDRDFTAEAISSGIPSLDELVHGGLERGTVTMLTGPTGAGKTTTGVQFMKEAAGRGERSVLYSFEEATETLVHRADAINIPIHDMLDRGVLSIEEIQPQDHTADEFSHWVRQEVEDHETRIVMIDGLDGYRHSLRDIDTDEVEDIALLSRYLKNMGVTTIVVNEIHRITGEFQATEAGLSYLADNIILLRHVEYQGELRKVIGVLKKRASDFEKSLRELEITENGIKVGQPLPELQGILSGTPEWSDDTNG